VKTSGPGIRRKLWIVAVIPAKAGTHFHGTTGKIKIDSGFIGDETGDAPERRRN
jgi:hypothetical protein